MHGLRALLLASLALLPLAAAEPLAMVPEDAWTMAFYGLAQPGSADANADWLFGSPVCIQVPGLVWVRLEVLTGADGDALRLEVPGVGVADAQLGQPVELQGRQGDPCPEFTVLGERVENAALYRVSARGTTA